jgi:KDO2-lipid IV(A) lauroyltransferase
MVERGRPRPFRKGAAPGGHWEPRRAMVSIENDGCDRHNRTCRDDSIAQGSCKLESYFVYLISRFALTSIRLLPRNAAIRILNGLASITYRLDSLHRRIARVNLTIAFPELAASEHDSIGRKSFQHTARNLLEVARLPGLTRENIGALVQYDRESGLGNLARAREGGKAILYLTGHFGAWELLPAAHALHGHPLSFVTRPLDNGPLENYLRGVREIAGNRVISKRNSVRQILQKLKKGEDVGILMDQNTSPEEGVFVHLFGMPAATSTSVALFAMRTGAAVLPGYLVPKPEGRYAIKFLPPVELIRTGDASSDVVENTRRFNGILERIIREQPETWLWGHRRWSRRPEGNPDLYSLPLAELRALVLRTREAESRRDPEGQG